MVAGGPQAFERLFQFLFYRLLLFVPKAITYHLTWDKYFRLFNCAPCFHKIGSPVFTLPVFPQPYRLAIPMWLLTFFFAFGRPPGNNLILEQIDTDVGAASSLMVFTFFMMGACSMWLISLGWQDKLQVLSIMGIISATIKFLGWFFINRRFRIKMA